VRNWRRRKNAKLVAIDAPTSAAAEAYRAVRANLEFIGRNGDVKVITLTSPALGEGKTTTTADLAVTLAKAGKRVIAVSCDLRKPRLHAFFALSNEVGLVDLLRDTQMSAEAMQRVPGIDKLRVIASGASPHDPAELLGSETMIRLLEALRAHADYVLLDTPPVLAVADALLLAPRTDGVIVIADAGTTTRSALGATRQELEQVGAKILGGVLNNLDPKRAKSYPSYVRDYYGYGYGRYTSKGHASENGHKAAEIDLEKQRNLWE
jgi:capsular exopolysaccharide synthesis family protein